MNDYEKKIIKTLNKIGVDTRYISLYEDNIFINNLKFSKFSRKKEDEFKQEYPNIDVVRSKLFQKICIKVSRTIKNQIKPRNVVYVDKNNTPENILLEIVLESYRRKYGITITDDKKQANIIASSKCINDFAEEYINLMTSGNKIKGHRKENTIYPLMHIDYLWITQWIDSTQIKYDNLKTSKNTISNEIINFLNTKIPNVQESIIQSVIYLDENRID